MLENTSGDDEKYMEWGAPLKKGETAMRIDILIHFGHTPPETKMLNNLKRRISKLKPSFWGSSSLFNHLG